MTAPSACTRIECLSALKVGTVGFPQHAVTRLSPIVRPCAAARLTPRPETFALLGAAVPQRGSGISPRLSVVLLIEAVAGSPAEYSSNIRAVFQLSVSVPNGRR